MYVYIHIWYRNLHCPSMSKPLSSPESQCFESTRRMSWALMSLTEVWSFLDFSAHTATIAGTWACCQMWHHPSRREAREFDAIWPQTLGLIHWRGWRGMLQGETALEKIAVVPPGLVLGSTWNFEESKIQKIQSCCFGLFLCSCYPQLAHALDELASPCWPTSRTLLDKALKRSVFT